MTVDGLQHFVLGQTMPTTREGARKGKRELTGAKEYLMRLRQDLGHFAVILTVEALYLTALFVTLVKKLGMQLVVRLKDEDRLLYKDIKPLFDQGWYRAPDFKGEGHRKQELRIEVNDYIEADMAKSVNLYECFVFGNTAKGQESVCMRRGWSPQIWSSRREQSGKS